MGSTHNLLLKLLFLSEVEASGIPSVAVEGEGGYIVMGNDNFANERIENFRRWYTSRLKQYDDFA